MQHRPPPCPGCSKELRYGSHCRKGEDELPHRPWRDAPYGKCSHGRIRYPDDVALWRREQLGQGMVDIPVDGEIGVRTAAMVDFHADPADRIIVATALGGHRLVTADERILAWSGNLDRLDAMV